MTREADVARRCLPTVGRFWSARDRPEHRLPVRSSAGPGTRRRDQGQLRDDHRAHRMVRPLDEDAEHGDVSGERQEPGHHVVTEVAVPATRPPPRRRSRLVQPVRDERGDDDGDGVDDRQRPIGERDPSSTRPRSSSVTAAPTDAQWRRSESQRGSVSSSSGRGPESGSIAGPGPGSSSGLGSDSGSGSDRARPPVHDRRRTPDRRAPPSEDAPRNR